MCVVCHQRNNRYTRLHSTQRSSRVVLFLMCMKHSHAKKYFLETFHLDPHTLSKLGPVHKNNIFIILCAPCDSSLFNFNLKCTSLGFWYSSQRTVNPTFLSAWAILIWKKALCSIVQIRKGICAHTSNVRALDAKQRINLFWPYWKENYRNMLSTLEHGIHLFFRYPATSSINTVLPLAWIPSIRRCFYCRKLFDR